MNNENVTTHPDTLATRLTRLAIGFTNVHDEWQAAKAHFTQNTLTILNHPVMERWEDTYMETLAEIATQQGGSVLEVGFGMGISAAYIQSHDVDKHILIEANADVMDRAKDFAKKAAHPVELLFGFWEDMTKQIPSGSLSGILFDTYPLTEEEIHKNHFSFFEEAHRMLRPDGVLTYYSDEAQDFSVEHIHRLQLAGFHDITKKICRVSPPLGCKYWQSTSLLAPIVVK